MRKIFYVTTSVLFLSLVGSCQNKLDNKESKSIEQINLKKDSLHISVQSCDSDFEKFFDKFSKDSTYQKEHIQFPLKFSSYDENEDIVVTEVSNKSNFSYIDFNKDKIAMKKEFDKYTIEKEVKKDRVIYKRVGFDNGIYISYEFKIIDKCWHMTSILDESM